MLFYSTARVYNNTIRVSTISFSPSVDYFFLNRFACGLLFDLGSQTTHYYSPSGRQKISSITIGPVARYYFLPQEKKTNIFVEGSYGFLFSKYKFFSSLDNDFTFHSSYYSIKAGPALFLNQHIALEVTLGV